MAITLSSSISGGGERKNSNFTGGERFAVSKIALLLILLTAITYHQEHLPLAPFSSVVEAAASGTSNAATLKEVSGSLLAANKTKNATWPPVKGAPNENNRSLSGSGKEYQTITTGLPETKVIKRETTTSQNDTNTTRIGDNLRNVNKSTPITIMNLSGGPPQPGRGRVGLKSAEGKPRGAQHNYKLPSWFNYELYKKFYGKPPYLSRLNDNEIHKRIYLRTALKVFEQRALYRAERTNTLSSINEFSDMTSEELLALKKRNNLKEQRKSKILDNNNNNNNINNNNNSNTNTIELLPDCCTYEQLYSRIIELLNKTTSSETADLTLSRAILEELEQKSLIANDESESATLELLGAGFGSEGRQIVGGAQVSIMAPAKIEQQQPIKRFNHVAQDSKAEPVEEPTDDDDHHHHLERISEEQTKHNLIGTLNEIGKFSFPKEKTFAINSVGGKPTSPTRVLNATSFSKSLPQILAVGLNETNSAAHTIRSSPKVVQRSGDNNNNKTHLFLLQQGPLSFQAASGGAGKVERARQRQKMMIEDRAGTKGSSIHHEQDDYDLVNQPAEPKGELGPFGTMMTTTMRQSGDADNVDGKIYNGIVESIKGFDIKEAAGNVSLVMADHLRGRPAFSDTPLVGGPLAGSNSSSPQNSSASLKRAAPITTTAAAVIGHLPATTSNNKSKPTITAAPNLSSRETTNEKKENDSDNNDEDEEDESLRAVEESVKKQIVEQVEGDSELGRQLRRQYSAYFGRPVLIKATFPTKQHLSPSAKSLSQASQLHNSSLTAAT